MTAHSVNSTLEVLCLKIMQILVRAESVLGRLVLDMDTAVKDSIRFTFIALKSVLQDKQGRRPRGHTPGTQVLEL